MAVSPAPAPEFVRTGKPVERDISTPAPSWTPEEIETFADGRSYREYQRDSGPKRVRLTRAALEKLECGALVAMLGNLQGSDAQLCREVMTGKGCFGRSGGPLELAGGMESPPAAKPSLPRPADPQKPESLLAKISLAAVGFMEHNEEMGALYQELGMAPPTDAWAKDLADALVKGVEAKTAANLAHVKEVEGMNNMLGGYQHVKQGDVPTKTYGPAVRPGRTGTGGEGAVDKVEVADVLYSDKEYCAPGDILCSGIPTKGGVEAASGRPELILTPEMEAMVSARGDTYMWKSSFWDGKSPPKHGEMKENGQLWSENYGQWVNRDVFLADEKIKQQQEQFKIQMETKAVKEQKALAAKEEIIEKLKKYKTPEEIAAMEKSLSRIITKGGTADDVSKFADKAVQQKMDEQQIESEEAEAEAELQGAHLAAAKLGVSVATAPWGVAGLAAEIGVYTYAGYLDGSAAKGFTEALWMNTPGTNTYTWYQNYKDGNAPAYGVLGSVLLDGLSAVGLYSTYGSAKAGHLLGSPLAKIDATLGAVDACQKAEKYYLMGEVRAKGQIDTLRETVAGIEAKAVREGGSFGDLMNDKTLRDQIIGIQANQQAKDYLNKTGDANLINRFNESLAGMRGVRDGIAENALKADLLSGARNKYPDKNVAVEIEWVKPTNPATSAKPKVSIDEDVTVRQRTYETLPDGSKKLLDQSDVNPEKLASHLDKAWYDALDRPDMSKVDPTGAWAYLCGKHKGAACTADETFAKATEQTSTWRYSADAYGSTPYHLESVLYSKGELFTNRMEYGRTFAHKGYEWIGNYEDLMQYASKIEAMGNAAKADGIRTVAIRQFGEGMRQETKQYDKHLTEAFRIINDTAAELGIQAPKGMPKDVRGSDVVQKAMGLMSKVGEVGSDGHVVTAELVNYQLKQLGFANGAKSVIESVSSYCLALDDFVGKNATLKSALEAKGFTARLDYMLDNPATKLGLDYSGRPGSKQ